MNVGLFDGTFPAQNSATLGGDNIGQNPAHVNWVRDQALPVTFYSDMCLDLAVGHPGNITKVAWLLEPYSISYTHYEKALQLQDIFNYILSFDKSYLPEGDKWKWYALGGSWIGEDDWVLDPATKTKFISLIGTEKKRARGHSMRHKIAELSQLFSIDVMGRGYRPIPSKIEALRPYYYSIVVENERIPGYFSEKLVDCISQGAVPIYWGCPNIDDYFDENGIIQFETIEQLIEIMVNLPSTNEWSKRFPSLRTNIDIARKYTCAEDWIYRHLPEIFPKWELAEGES